MNVQSLQSNHQYQRLDARLQYLQCVSDGESEIQWNLYYKATDKFHGVWRQVVSDKENKHGFVKTIPGK